MGFKLGLQAFASFEKRASQTVHVCICGSCFGYLLLGQLKTFSHFAGGVGSTCLRLAITVSLPTLLERMEMQIS
eukprot:2935743-Amphidinium_carterae.1